MTASSVRRVVTGHDAQGRAIIQEDRAVPRVQRVGGDIGPLFHEVWNTRATPAPIDAASGEPAEQGIVLAPPKNGTRIRVLDIPPQIVRGNSAGLTSASQAAAYQAFIGKGFVIGLTPTAYVCVMYTIAGRLDHSRLIYV